MRDKSKKTSAKGETRRLERKSERQATKAVLRGDHSSQPLSSNWGYKPEPVILSDDAKVVAPRGKSKGKSKHCKRNKNGPHVIGYKSHPDWWKSGAYCVKCNKKFWGNPPKNAIGARPTQVDRPEHWTYTNIINRLTGLKCTCPDCLDKTSDS